MPNDTTCAECPYSGLALLSCKVSDLCDCFDFPEVDEMAVERAARREASCSHCPPGCVSCEPVDCECYAHQDEPDRRFAR